MSTLLGLGKHDQSAADATTCGGGHPVGINTPPGVDLHYLAIWTDCLIQTPTPLNVSRIRPRQGRPWFWLIPPRRHPPFLPLDR